MGNNINKIFKKRACLSAAELEGYARETLKPRERNQIERHLLDCELCSDALMGYMESRDKISLLKMKSTLANRFVSKSHAREHPAAKSYSWIWAAAAVVCIVLISGIFWKFNQNKNNELAIMQVKDSINETVQPVPMERFEATNTITKPEMVAVPEVRVQRESGEEQIKENSSGEMEIAAKFNQPSANEQEAVVYTVADDKKAEEKQADMQPGTRDMYGNAYNPSNSDSNLSTVNQAAIKKKSAVAASESASVKDLPVSWNDIFKLAENGQYQKAMLSVDQLQHEKDQLKKSYYKGFYQYKLERYNEAILQFEKLRRNESHSNYNDAQFYRAMSLISTGKNKEGKEILNRIVKEKLPHHENAAETLRLLD